MLLRLFSLSLAVVAAASHRVPVKSLRLPTSAQARRCAPVVMEKGREAEDVSGAVANTFGDIFGSLFKPNAEKEAEIERAYQAQLEVAELRRNPEAYRKKLAKTEAARAKASEEFLDGIAWQRSANPLEAFKKRQQEGKVKPLGYEDEPKGGIPLPSASFGVGGEFGVGGKFDNGQRFDLRLPFVEQGWVEEAKPKSEPEPTRNWWEPKPKAPAKAEKKEPTKAPTNPLEWWIQQQSKQ